ncbi:NADPH-dependent oxidoreductase [Xanthobacter tagetidis]|nr:NADPH-dependent oxidoreductase [Xanthobacter tagetidis]MBB6306978.1 nitroreductase [Xanthobacter tagetidis]
MSTLPADSAARDLAAREHATRDLAAEMASLLEARYGAAGASVDIRLNDVIAGLLAHRTVRAFADRPLPPGTVETLAAAAQSAASSSNLQALSVIAVEDAGTRRALAELAGGQAHVAQAPLVMVWLADLSRLTELGRRQSAPTEGLDYLEMLLVAVIDAALAAQNAVVALESLGLGSCYIGALRNRPREVADLLGLPPHVVAVFGLCVGHPDPARPARVKPRLPQDLVLHRERYDPSLPAAAVAGYDATLAAFQQAEGMAQVGWTSTALNRVRGPKSLSGRDRLAGILQELGFPLR